MKMGSYRFLGDRSFSKQKCATLTKRSLICIVCCIAVYAVWLIVSAYSPVNIPPKLIEIPQFLINRTFKLSHYNVTTIDHAIQMPVLHTETTEPTPQQQRKLVCYYTSPSALNHSYELYPKQIDPFLCTHINIGIIFIENNSITLDETAVKLFEQATQLKEQNKNLKVLMWIGGPSDSAEFLTMIAHHSNRMTFIQSVQNALETYQLDGIDLDWEFPLTYDNQKVHFSQLLQEIRQSYQRKNRTYLLSVAVAAPEGIAFYAYDIKQMNIHCDYVNIMSYDYHFYSETSPFTGFNAPLYRRHDEHSIFAVLNINSSADFWHKYGLDKEKIIIGLPTYGHSFRLVNPFNAKIGSPASGFGQVGMAGFVTYADVCWFARHNFFVRKVYDEESCSPYITAGTEWISYEDERSITCKTKYVRDNGFGGVMIFSLNTDDYASSCFYGQEKYPEFPLIRSISSILFDV